MGYRSRKYKDEPPGYWCKFDYDIVNRNPDQLKDFEETVREWHDRMYQHNTIEKFPKNEGACSDFKGCQYRPLCVACNDEAIKESLYKKVNAFEYLEKESVR